VFFERRIWLIFCLVQLVDSHGPDANHHLVRRLILASGPALSASGASSAPAQAQLALRLLLAETRRLSRDPLLAQRWKDAFSAGLYDLSSPSDIFRQFDLPLFLDRAELSPLERLVLLHELVQPPTGLQHAQQLQRAAVFRRSAFVLLREVFPRALEALRSITLGQPGPSEVLPDLTPVQISKLYAGLLGDVSLDEEHSLLDVTQQREFVAAAGQRLSNAELASQVAALALEHTK
jgi:CCR4-NOT transcription complex subunit 1